MLKKIVQMAKVWVAAEGKGINQIGYRILLPESRKILHYETLRIERVRHKKRPFCFVLFFYVVVPAMFNLCATFHKLVIQSCNKPSCVYGGSGCFVSWSPLPPIKKKHGKKVSRNDNGHACRTIHLKGKSDSVVWALPPLPRHPIYIYIRNPRELVSNWAYARPPFFPSALCCRTLPISGDILIANKKSVCMCVCVSGCTPSEEKGGKVTDWS